LNEINVKDENETDGKHQNSIPEEIE